MSRACRRPYLSASRKRECLELAHEWVVQRFRSGDCSFYQRQGHVGHEPCVAVSSNGCGSTNASDAFARDVEGSPRHCQPADIHQHQFVGKFCTLDATTMLTAVGFPSRVDAVQSVRQQAPVHRLRGHECSSASGQSRIDGIGKNR